MIPKRLFDLVLTLPGVVVLAPAGMLISLWIKLDSPGPVLFRQLRVGRDGRPFQMLKLRTMVSGAEARGLALTTGNDLRITRAGRILRRFKLDEFPQLFNVLRGEMSLVGPRPEVRRYVDCYPADVKDLVLSVPPGSRTWRPSSSGTRTAFWTGRRTLRRPTSGKFSHQAPLLPGIRQAPLHARRPADDPPDPRSNLPLGA